MKQQLYESNIFNVEEKKDLPKEQPKVVATAKEEEQTTDENVPPPLNIANLSPKEKRRFDLGSNLSFAGEDNKAKQLNPPPNQAEVKVFEFNLKSIPKNIDPVAFKKAFEG